MRVSKFADLIASLYGSIMGEKIQVEEFPANDGFKAVANEAVAIYAISGENEQTFKVPELAQRLRQAYALPTGMTFEPWEVTPFLNQCAWNAVARFCAYAPQADTADEASDSVSEFFMLAKQQLERGQNV